MLQLLLGLIPSGFGELLLIVSVAVLKVASVLIAGSSPFALGAFLPGVFAMVCSSPAQG
jgi:hypothetical protein